MKKIYLRCIICVLLISFFCSGVVSEIPAGYYYFAKDKKAAELKTALAQHSAPLSVLNYGGGTGYTWEGFYKADQLEDGSIWDMYSGIVRYFDGFKAVSGMHIEHSLPKSWWGGHVNNAYQDLFHLYPADGQTNSTKNDLPLGEVTGVPNFDNGVSKTGKNGFGTAYTANCFEPADDYKGDFARSYFYISTVYENFDHLWKSVMMDNNTYPVWKSWALELLMKWHEQDPVSEKESARNESVYGIQGNRNPFIDYPNLVDYIWGSNTNNTFPFPVETEPFLVYPRIGASVDFGVILQNNTKQEQFSLLGANINSNITLALKGDTLFSLSAYSVSQQNALAGTDITITFTPKFSGTARDTLVISGGGINTLLVPLKALASTEFIVMEPTDVTPVGGVLQWISDADATGYLVSVYEGDTKAGDLFFSSYVEGSSWNKAIEIFNGTGETVNLSNYSLRKQSNGIGNFGSNYRLSGNLNSGETYVIVHRSSTNNDLQNKAQVFTDSVANFNGNDAVALYRNGVMIDIIGYADDGGEVFWGQDKTLTRKSGITHPITQYNEDEWDVYAIDTFDKLGAHSADFASASTYIFQDRPVGTDNTYLTEELMPEKTYTYQVEAIIAGGNKTTVNTTHIHTTGLETPLALSATDINSTSFVANWEDTPYAAGYLLDVFQLEGAGSVTDTTDFNDVNNGKPLPEGWSGTASGSYASVASSGRSPNSIGFAASEQYLQTKEYPNPVSKLTFMYRFPSSGAGNILIVDGLFGDNWENIDSLRYTNTSKTYPEYNFATANDVKAFKFTFIKNNGNLAMDDIEITYGKSDTTYIKRNEVVTGNGAAVSGLNLHETYYYNLRATLGESVSSVSETIETYTEVGTGVDSNETDLPVVFTSQGNIVIKGLNKNELVSVYSISGICIYQTRTTASELMLPIDQRGIYLVNVQGKNKPFTLKVIK